MSKYSELPCHICGYLFNLETGKPLNGSGIAPSPVNERGMDICAECSKLPWDTTSQV